MNKKIKKNKAFTLLELLIVVAIIGLLIGIAIPTFRGIMARGRDAAIKGNMRTIQTTASLIRAERGDFSTVHCNPGGDPEIRAICEKIRANSPHPGQVRSFVTARSFCIQAPLHSRKFWRVDSAGFSGYDLCGYVGRWDMDEGTGTRVHDRSVNANHGTMHNFAPPHGWVGGAISFDGVDDWVNVPYSPTLDITHQKTIEAWITTGTLPLPEWGAIVGRWEGLSLWSYRTGHLVAKSHIGGHWRGLWTGVYIQPNRWHHFVSTFDGTTWIVYVDGVERKRYSVSGLLHIGGHSLWIGAFWGGAHHRFRGLIDDVRIYNRALTAEEVYALFRQGR